MKFETKFRMEFIRFWILGSMALWLIGCARAQQPAANPKPVTPTKEGVLKIGVGDLQGPISIHTSPAGGLVVLDQRGADNFAVVGYSPDGAKVAETAVPAEISKPRTAVADSAGNLYAFSTSEFLIYHFDAAGKFIEKIGGGPHPPRVGVPAGFMGSTYDVDENGDVYWTLGNYGPLLMLSADGKIGVHYRGQESEYVGWTGSIHAVTGFALAGERGYEIDGNNILDAVSLFCTEIPPKLAPSSQNPDLGESILRAHQKMMRPFC